MDPSHSPLQTKTQKTCAICTTDSINLPYALDCGHVYCYLCIKSHKLANKDKAVCPLCRVPIGKDITEKAKLNQCINTKPRQHLQYVWYYHGRNNGWWKYDDESCFELEKMYQEYVNKKNQQTLKSSYGFGFASNSTQTTVTSFSISDAYILDIGNMEFGIDFDDMTQTNQNNKGVRKICRQKFQDGPPANMKGIAGLSNKI